MTTSTQIEPALIQQLHRLLRQTADLESRKRKCPVRLTMAQEKCTELESRRTAAQDAIRKSRLGADQKQLQLNEREARIEDLKGKRNACSSNREYQLLSDQIAADQQANSVQSDEILELLERIDTLQADLKETEDALAAAKAEATKVGEVVGREIAQLDSELQQVQAELKESLARIPADVRQTVNRLRASLGEDAIARVEDNSCGHCNTTLVTQQISELAMNQVVWCKSCGSLLYCR